MEWRPAAGFPNYEVSASGFVRSVPRPGARGGLLTGSTDKKGYRRVTLYRDGKTHVVRVHVLVALTYLGPRPDGLQVRHRDGVKDDCSVGNLQYGTNSQNQLDSVEHGTHPWSRREACVNGHPFTPENTAHWASL